MKTQRSLVRRIAGQRGQALIETALTLPIVLVISISIFEFGRALQVWQLLTNAAREGARVAVLPGSTPDVVQNRVLAYMAAGGLENRALNQINIVSNAADRHGRDAGERVADHHLLSLFVHVVEPGDAAHRTGLGRRHADHDDGVSPDA